MKTSKRLLSILLMLAMLVSMFTVMAFAEDCNNHEGHETVEYHAADCTHPGNWKYDHCLKCGLYWIYAESGAFGSDDVADTVIPALGHTLRHVEGKEPTETEYGMKACYECSVCRNLFWDENGTNPVGTPEDLWIPPTGASECKHEHTIFYPEDNGYYAHVYCLDCKLYFAATDDGEVRPGAKGEKDESAFEQKPVADETTYSLTIKVANGDRGTVQVKQYGKWVDVKNNAVLSKLSEGGELEFRATGYSTRKYTVEWKLNSGKTTTGSTKDITMPGANSTLTVSFVTKSSDDSHSHTWVTKYNDTYHWLECSKCGAETGKVKHTIKSKTDRHGYWYDYCTECDWTSDYNYNHSSSHKGYTYEEINSTYHWKTCKDCNYSVKEYHTWIRNTDRRTNDTYPYVCKYCDALSRTTYSDLPFHDVSDRYWYYDDVLYAYLNGLMDGISVTSFGADQNTTRGQVVTILWRLSGEPRAARNNQFTDVASSAYYNTAISWAAENGIVKGYDAKTFRPNANVTREQLAAILYRYAEYMNLSTKGASNLTKFDDYYSIGTWARDSLAWANYHGLINGVDSYRIDPKGNTTRAQLAAILHRFAVEFA